MDDITYNNKNTRVSSLKPHGFTTSHYHLLKYMLKISGRELQLQTKPWLMVVVQYLRKKKSRLSGGGMIILSIPVLLSSLK